MKLKQRNQGLLERFVHILKADTEPTKASTVMVCLLAAVGLYLRSKSDRSGDVALLLGMIDVRSEHESMCAEYALAIWNYASMPPTDKATPASCADGAMLIWNAPIYAVENGGRK